MVFFIVIYGLAIIMLILTLIFHRSTKFWKNQMATGDFDKPEPWYVKFTSKLMKHGDK